MKEFQNFAQSINNVKNISKTLSERQQMRACSSFYRGMFRTERVILPVKVTLKKDLVESTPMLKDLRRFMADDDLLVNEVSVDGQNYCTGDLLVVKAHDCDSLEMGLVQAILVRGSRVYFICKMYTCKRTWLQYFENEDVEDQHCPCRVEHSELADYKPLIMRGTTKKFIFVVHHRISHTVL